MSAFWAHFNESRCRNLLEYIPLILFKKHVSAAARELGAAFELSDPVVPINASSRSAMNATWGKKSFQKHLQKKHGNDSRMR